MKNNLFKIHWGFIAATVFLFVIEVLIAMYVRGFIRSSMGDVLVVILIYCFFRSFYQGARFSLPLYVFLFAVLIEVGQAFHIADRLSLAHGSALRIAVGTTFEWGDILCYAVGGAICYLVEKRRSYRV